MKKFVEKNIGLTKFKPYFKNVKRSLRKGGRNNLGRITVRHQGGGVKQVYRYIDFKRVFNSGIVTNLEYDPNRSAYLAKLISFSENEKENGAIFYILAPKGLRV